MSVATLLVLAAAPAAVVALVWKSSRLSTVKEASNTPSSVLNATDSRSGRRRSFRRMTGSDSEAEVSPRRPDEQEKVLSHREQMFRYLGFNEFQSIALAESSVDWHAADALIKSGCSREIALDILL